MVQIRTRCLLGIACLGLPFLASAKSSPSSKSPSAKSDLICPTDNAADCYPRIFVPTKDFQIIKEGQDIPPGLHVRMDVYGGTKEARLNIPMEGEEEYALEDVPIERAMVIVEQPEVESEVEPEMPALRDQVPMNPPVYESAGKIPPPIPNPETGDEFGTFQKALQTIKTEKGEFDTALDDLADLSHDIYYGVEITKDGPVLEKLVCLMLGAGTKNIPAKENDRDHKAASILSSALQNNPTALKELSSFLNLVKTPACGPATQADFVSILRQNISQETPGSLKAKISAISGLLKEPIFRQEFLQTGGMELLLKIFLTKGDEFNIVRKKVAQLTMDSFLDEGMGAALGQWPRSPVQDTKTCQREEKMLGDGCWEYHIEKFLKAEPKEIWAREFSDAVREQRRLVDVGGNREL